MANRFGLMAALAAATMTVMPTAALAFDPLADMLAGRSAMKGKKLERAIEKAAKHPLGSAENPVRAHMPQGQRAYLAKLRCADGKAPTYFREGNFGIGVYRNIVDGYRVTCDGSEPASSLVYMDMYHAGHVENAAVPGFTLDDGSPQPADSTESNAVTSASSL
jgi:hypothetical protein